MSIKFLALLFACGLFFLPMTGYAQTTAPAATPSSGPFPPPALGIWSAPDCADGQSVIVLSKFYQLNILPNSHRLTTITHWRMEDFDDETLFFYITDDGDGHFFKMTNDGLIMYLLYFVHPKQELHTAWDRMIEKLSHEYTRCSKLFNGQPVVTQDEVNLPFLLDQIKTPCMGIDPDHFSKARSCHDALFSAVDSNNNKSLENTELTRLYQQADFLRGSVASGCKIASDNDTESAFSSPKNAGDFTTAIMSFADKDKNGSLTQAEVEAALSNPLSYPLYQTLLQKLRAVRFALGFLPMSAAEKICSSGAPVGNAQPYTGTINLNAPAESPLSLDNGSSSCGCGG